MLIPLLAAAALCGCGGDEETTSAGPTPTPPPAATEAPTATPTATATPTPTATDAPTPDNPEAKPGGAGDEQETRVPVELTIGSGGIKPPQVSVPGFLAIEMIVHNTLPVEVVVRLQGAKPIAVGPGETGRAKVAGRKPGSYIIDAGVAGKALLVTGVEPGP